MELQVTRQQVSGLETALSKVATKLNLQPEPVSLHVD